MYVIRLGKQCIVCRPRLSPIVDLAESINQPSLPIPVVVFLQIADFDLLNSDFNFYAAYFCFYLELGRTVA